ncbi:MAG TPA: VCBS repeat-containing protein, partial [Flavobacteriales bacterium]|nr:VCBS repeat-containing protein [Flavobacteriales bacterium]
MKKHLSCLTILISACTASAQDGCATALHIVAGTYTVAAVNGPEIPDLICALNGNTNVTASEWYTYTPAQDLALTITTEASGVDTRFSVYTGSCGALVCAGGDDDSGVGNTSLTTINVVGGLMYTIAFDNRWTAAGFQFQLLENAIVETPISFTQVYLPGGGYVQCVVDMDGDMLDDAVYATQNYVSIDHQLAGGGFANMLIGTPTVVNSSSWSIAAGDLDDNGYTDLLYGGGNGCSILLANEDGTYFTAISPPQYIFSQRTNMVDINNDGHLDVFVCHDIAPNVYYYHDGNGNFEYHQGGLGDNGGNYGSIWTDYDGDHDIDMFIAKCGSSPPDVLCRNNGDGSFTNVAAELGFADYQQSWSSAWGDFDNDADMDALIGSSSSGYHKLMLNDGTGHFTNITPGSGFDSFFGQ